MDGDDVELRGGNGGGGTIFKFKLKPSAGAGIFQPIDKPPDIINYMTL